ncbi:HNH endonuclease [Niallia nealsonii]|nr:HNH endonuclease [Niallia nealsonii]
MAETETKALKRELHNDMFNIYNKAKSIGYNATKFRQMLAGKEGYLVAKSFIYSKSPTDGFTSLWELKRLDLTVEALVLNPKYVSLFTEEERCIVRDRLAEYGYQIEMREQENTDVKSIPELEPVLRSREYNNATAELRSKVVYEYLFHGRSHRWIDEYVIGLNPSESRGYQAMGILHYIGLKSKHKGFFEKSNLDDALVEIKRQSSDFKLLIENLDYVNQAKKIESKLASDIDAEQSEEDGYYKDGAIKYYHGKRYERNPVNRRKAIEIHGLDCKVCGFNFEKNYGKRGADFIEIHHLNQLSTLEEETIVNPETDLIPLCSNCHRMIHRKKDVVLTVEELKEIMAKNGKGLTV